MSYLDARSWFELPADERRRTIEWLRGWDHKPKLLAAFLDQLESDLRESGGSLPAADPWRSLKEAGLRAEAVRERPLLNKSGGSDVEGK